MNHQFVVRVLATLTIVLGINYILWRWLFSVNWSAAWISVPLAMVETYSLIDAFLFGVTMWRLRVREVPPAPAEGLSVDVFITTYNEPVDLVMTTAIAARRISYPHKTWILDDGARPAMKGAAEAAGIGYITRSPDWDNLPRHAKAGNLNNALAATQGEFLLILDADQIPEPGIVHSMLGHFNNEKVALVQTPQWFSNVADDDILGSQAPLFYGPIQQGKDGWNAAFFCGSNAMIRREALMQIGITGYVNGVTATVKQALKGADKVIARARTEHRTAGDHVILALEDIGAAVRGARQELKQDQSVANITYGFQRRVDLAARSIVMADIASLTADLDEIERMQGNGTGVRYNDEAAIDRLARRDWSPIGAMGSLRGLVRDLDVDRPQEALPVMPMATNSVTEDMATCMRLHAAGWESVYHHEILAKGLAPEDLRTMLTQRLRWAQGTMQVFLRENPLLQRGLSAGQRLMYFSTMWSYLSGFAAVVYIAAPIIFLCFGVMPVDAFSSDFFARLIPFLIVNQVLFFVAARGRKTWRGQQYSLALFPVWIKACTTAAGNVLFGRDLGFAVTPKTRQKGGPPWSLIRAQLAAIAALVLAAVLGLVRMFTGLGAPAGTLVNVAWVIYDLLILSVIIRAALYKGFTPNG
ncbi:cellulose synthase (UDP-forming) [Arthrobacter pascens]|jgi:cellulose synthase (UDP-forming)|uniref:glycosyltransferase family 2 protein n=1 Tax=Arthrobacter pascens TaxID=1677 RepID=UPI0027892591|nr:glycosyltransferase [Arthrobacter pascens]MDQ0635741.1 cellulose synthase (UDP-forming) [Arthrobacter pascens]